MHTALVLLSRSFAVARFSGAETETSGVMGTDLMAMPRWLRWILARGGWRIWDPLIPRGSSREAWTHRRRFHGLRV